MTEQVETKEVQDSGLELNNVMLERRAKLEAIRAQGIAFPNDFRRDAISDEIHAKYENMSTEELAELKPQVKIAGRMMTRRIMGKASFANLMLYLETLFLFLILLFVMLL